tara:strand:- start:64 stop:309 length:246 start_codon:yes stop_codon:yes gene_type:complete
MKISKPNFKHVSDFQKDRICGPLNVFSLCGVSMLWGHMLGLLNLWFLPLTILLVLIGYGSEINKEKPVEPEDKKPTTINVS